jgi:hypothetical protein
MRKILIGVGVLVIAVIAIVTFLFRLTIGNKDGTEVFLNGKKLDVPESKENVVKDFIINPKLIE